MSHYAAVSAEIHDVFLSFTPLVEPIALDEAFLDISGSLGLFGQPKQLGLRLKQAVLEKTALNVSVGIAPNKLVAKIACTFGKPNGLMLVEPDQVREFLRPLPIRRLWGVGPVLAERLHSLGIRTFAELTDFDPKQLERAIGRRAGELQSLALGHDTRPVEADRIPKSYGEESTFERDVLAREVVTAALTAHSEAVARRLRRDSFRGRTVTLKIKLGVAKGSRIARGANPFGEAEPNYPLLTRSRTLSEPTDSGSTIREIAVSLWDEAQVTTPVRLLGVSLSNLVPREHEQLDMFEQRKEDRLGPALDAIIDRFGPNAISRAVDAPAKVTPSGRRKRGET